MFQVSRSEGRQRQKRVFLGLAALFIFISGASLIYLSIDFPDFSGQPHQPDRQMIANFQTHKTEFEYLRQMVTEDKWLTRVDDDWTEPRDPQTIGILPDRIAKYRRIFHQLGIPRGISATAGRDRIEFIASSQGWVASGSSKSYVYLAKRPDEVLDDLDSLSSLQKPFGIGYKHIEGNWYLYFYGD